MPAGRVLATHQARDAAKQLLALTGTVKQLVGRVLQQGRILADPSQWEGGHAGRWRHDWGADANHLSQTANKLDELEHKAQQVIDNIFKVDDTPPGAVALASNLTPPIQATTKGQRGAPKKPGLLDRLLGSAERGIGDVVDGVENSIGKAAGDTVRAVGDGVGGLLEDVGKVTGIDGIVNAGQTVKESLHNAGNTAEDFMFDRGALFRHDMYDYAKMDDGRNVPVTVYIDPDEYPEAAQHIQEAQSGTSWRGDQQIQETQPSILTVDRPGADANRSAALRGIPTKPGYDRDEYPPAMFDEGGASASVKYVNVHDNRGSGRRIQQQTADLDDGDTVKVEVY